MRSFLSPMGNAAAHYARRGWPVLPLHTPIRGHCSCDDDDCKSVGKHPRINEWRERASTDVEQVADWWRSWPHANIGLATGRSSGLVVIDIDANHGGETSFATLKREHNIPHTAIAATGGGRHLYFSHSYGAAGENASYAELRNSMAGLGRGIDVRADGGYIVAPPSQHANGRNYRWIGSRPLAALPLSIATELAPAEPSDVQARSMTAVSTVGRLDAYARAAFHRELDAVRGAPVSGRNNQLNASAFSLGQLVAGGALSHGAVVDGLTAAAASAGLGQREIARTVTSGVSAGMRKPRALPLERDGPPAAEPLHREPSGPDSVELPLP